MMAKRKSEFKEMTVQDALELARIIKHGPGSSVKNYPLPDKDEALELIKAEYRRSSFNWLTAQKAIRLLGGKKRTVNHDG